MVDMTDPMGSLYDYDFKVRCRSLERYINSYHSVYI